MSVSRVQHFQPSRRTFERLTTREVHRLASDSRSLTALTWLWASSTFLTAALFATGVHIEGLEAFEGLSIEAQGLLVLFMGVTALGCQRREGWARLSGGFLCLLLMLSQTWFLVLVGGFGLIVFHRAGMLLGRGHLDPHKLRYELEARTSCRKRTLPGLKPEIVRLSGGGSGGRSSRGPGRPSTTPRRARSLGSCPNPKTDPLRVAASAPPWTSRRPSSTFSPRRSVRLPESR